jgi:hypothetical protein
VKVSALDGDEFLALEHWGNAVGQAEVAAHNMVHAETARWPHLAVPEFWSTQFGHNIKSVGVPGFADQVAIVQGSAEERRFVAAYGHRDGRPRPGERDPTMAGPDVFAQILDDANRANPYPLYAERRRTPVARQDDGTYVVSTHRAIAALMHDPRMSSDRRSPEARARGTASFINLDPPEHDRIRRLVMRHFGPPASPARIDRLRPELTRIVTGLIDDFGTGRRSTSSTSSPTRSGVGDLQPARCASGRRAAVPGVDRRPRRPPRPRRQRHR